MEKAIIDVSKKKNIKIINNGREVEEQAKMMQEFEEMERRLFGAYRQELCKEQASAPTSTPTVKKKSIFNRIFGARKPQKTSK